MKIDPNAPAIPVMDESTRNETSGSHYLEWRGGLTIRAEIASRNLAGLLANPDARSEMLPTDFIVCAFHYADLFIARLNEETPP